MMFLLPNIGDGFVKCEKCGYEMKKENKYCFSCGSEIDKKDAHKQINEKMSYSESILEFKKETVKKKKSTSSVDRDKVIATVAFILFLFLIFRSCANSGPKPKDVKDWTGKDYNNFMDYKEKEYQKRMDDTPIFK
jgi:uncharacterized membrane protein YvbJ